MSPASQAALTRRGFVGAAATAAGAASAHGANDRIRLGLIGVGGRGTNHVTELIRLKDLNVTVGAICDVYRPNREKAAATIAREFGAAPRTTTNYQELLSWKDLDAVIIAAPDFTHPIMLKAAVEAGKDAYVEKPFATNFADAKAAYLAAKKTKQVVQVGTQRRSDGHFMAAAKIMRSGMLGKVARIEIAMNAQGQRWKRFNEKIDPADVDWEMFRMGRIDRSFDPSLLREWQLHKETTNGIPGLWMCHFIDLVPWFMDDPYPAGAVSNGGIYLWKDGRDHADVFYTLLDYPQGFLVDFSMTLITNAGIQNCWYGTKGYLDCEKWIVSGEGSTLKDRVPADIKIEPETTNSHLHNFLECVRSRGNPRADVQAGFSHAVAGCMSAEAFEKQRKVRFDPVKLEII